MKWKQHAHGASADTEDCVKQNLIKHEYHTLVQRRPPEWASGGCGIARSNRRPYPHRRRAVLTATPTPPPLSMPSARHFPPLFSPLLPLSSPR